MESQKDPIPRYNERLQLKEARRERLLLGSAAGIVVGMVALSWWAFKDLLDVDNYVKKTPKNQPHEKGDINPLPSVNETAVKDVEPLNPTKQHLETLTGGKEVRVTIREENVLDDVPNPETAYHFVNDIVDIHNFEESIKNRTASYDLDGQSPEQIDELWAEAGRILDRAKTNRLKMEELRFHKKNDPRMIALFREACEAMGQGQIADIILKTDGLQVQVLPVGRELIHREGSYSGSFSVKDNPQGVIYLHSNALVAILNGVGPEYVLAAATFANETCHKVHTYAYGSWEEYQSAYKTGWPESAVDNTKIPDKIAEFYDRVFMRYYSSFPDTAHGRIERESFYVGFLTAQKILENGVTIQLDEQASKALQWNKTHTK